MRLNEFDYKNDVTKAIQEHIERGVPFTECMFRPGSQAFTDFYREVKRLYNEGKIEVDWQDAELLETDIGECIIVEGDRVPLDVPIEIAEEEVEEAYESPLDSPKAKTAREKLQKTLKDIKKKYPDHPAVQNVKAEEDADAVRELVLYANNDGTLYQQSAVPIMKNLTRKWRKGVYDSELAAKLWLYHATRAAKNYAQEFGYAFSVQDRKAAAKEFEENWRAELEAGNAMEGKIYEETCGEKGVKPNSPKRGGPKKFYVYVNTPSGNCKKISWGDTTGLNMKTGNRERVRSFVARHKCKQKNDRTKAGYWACRTPRYKSLGVKGGQWW